ncbi:MAG: hypothetical protein ACNS62_22970 [Candidatus Cyclobacteriaceae bacterium M3_2C_046]
MAKMLIAGASGSLGFEVLKIAADQHIPVRALVWSPTSREKVKPHTDDVFVADARKHAAVVWDHLWQGPELMEVGGPQIHSRNEIAALIQQKIKTRIIHLPMLAVIPGLLALRLITENTQAKLDFFKYVSTHDMLVQPYGNITFRQYLDHLDLNRLK